VVEIKYATFNVLKDVLFHVPLENMSAKIGKHKNNAGFLKTNTYSSERAFCGQNIWISPNNFEKVLIGFERFADIFDRRYRRWD
jgi:hypothetical protein